MNEAETDRELLMERFPVHKQRQGQGNQTFTYVEGEAVIRRLLDATGGAYSWEILSAGFREMDGKVPAYAWVQGRLTLPGLGSKDAIGTASTLVGAEDCLKSADTDALKRAAVKFGVALYLYDGVVPATPARMPANASRSHAQTRKEEEATVAEGQTDEAETEAAARFWKAARSLSIPFPALTLGKLHDWQDRQGLTQEEPTAQEWIDAAEGMKAYGRAARETGTLLEAGVTLGIAAQCFVPPPDTLTAITRAMWVQMANYLLDGKEQEKAS